MSFDYSRRDAFDPTRIASGDRLSNSVGISICRVTGSVRIPTRQLFPAPTVQFTTLTPATNPCTGNTQGFEYNFTYATGTSIPAPLFVVAGTTNGYLPGTVLGLSSSTGVVAGGRSLVGGAAQNGVTMDISGQAASTLTGGLVNPQAGMPTGANDPLCGWGTVVQLTTSFPVGDSCRIWVTLPIHFSCPVIRRRLEVCQFAMSDTSLDSMDGFHGSNLTEAGML